MPAPRPHRIVGAILLVLALGLSGCSAAESEPLPTPSSTSGTPSAASATPQPTPSPLPPGRTLRSLGYLNGPVEEFTVPEAAVLSATVDQENNVTVVLSQPSAAEVADYLRAALPAAGFTITKDDPATLAMTFTGFGWAGSFTGSATAAAVLLRPL
ncbi:MAG TPA: hypothetical protein VLJ88_08265 [Propionibacteriaceae bacterium]|nr:hypothetical protein [Propionibacteriaceae bacterium]